MHTVYINKHSYAYHLIPSLSLTQPNSSELKSFVRLRTSQSGNVQRLSRGFENLEAEARADEEINPFDRVSSIRSRAPTSLAAVSEAQPSPAAGPPPTCKQTTHSVSSCTALLTCMMEGWTTLDCSNTHTYACTHMHTSPATIPTLQVLQKALTPVSGKWYQFGINLGIQSPELHRVEKKCLGR